MKSNKYLFLGLLMISLMLLSTPFSMAASVDTKEIVITIQNFSFNPAEVTVVPGTKVTWINQDTVGHNVVFSDSKGPILNKGDQWSMVFDKAGTYPYNCGPHHFMKGTIIVK
jgi:amicyanin